MVKKFATNRKKNRIKGIYPTWEYTYSVCNKTAKNKIKEKLIPCLPTGYLLWRGYMVKKCAENDKKKEEKIRRMRIHGEEV